MKEQAIDMGHVIQAPNAQRLADNVSTFLLQKTGGAYWVEPTANEHLYFAARRAYYVHLPEGTRKVVTAYHRILKKNIHAHKGDYSLVVPSIPELHQAFDQAEQRKDNASYKAVIHTFSPSVAMVDSVGNQLSRFKYAYTRYLQKGKPLPEQGAIDPKYIHHMFALNILKGDRRDGYQLSEYASGYIEHYRKMYGQQGVGFDEGDPTPFIALCIQNPEYLSKELNIGTPQSYFRLLHTLFLQGLTLSSLPGQENMGTDLRSLASLLRRRGYGNQKEDELQNRMGNLVKVHVVEDIQHERFGLKKEWFNLAKGEFDESYNRAIAAV